jgi:uncharacterized protein with von Willebrand factor type A (vWA) domain
MASDLAEVSARFGAALRQAGLPVGAGRCERFAAAVTVARPATKRALYLCALATLVSSKEQGEVLRGVFNQVFDELGGELAGLAGGSGAAAGEQAAQPAGPPEELLASTALAARSHGTPPAGAQRSEVPDRAQESGEPEDPDREIEDRFLGSLTERLASKDFAELSETELNSVVALMRQITLAVPARSSRRYRRSPGGRRIDLRATLRQARRTGGHTFRLIGTALADRPRRLVVLCDISGSMEPYARAMIQFLYCAAGGASAEVFTFATRLTRLTRVLARTSPEQALRQAGQVAPDWLGGTKIGSALKEFNDSYGRRGMARGAVIVIISDGWETGDPQLLRTEMERLSLVAYRIVWVNPRTKSASYQPLAGGMAAAWPHCDAIVSAHTVTALDQLTKALSDQVRRRATVRTAYLCRAINS